MVAAAEEVGTAHCSGNSALRGGCQLRGMGPSAPRQPLSVHPESGLFGGTGLWLAADPGRPPQPLSAVYVCYLGHGVVPSVRHHSSPAAPRARCGRRGFVEMTDVKNNQEEIPRCCFSSVAHEIRINGGGGDEEQQGTSGPQDQCSH